MTGVLENTSENNPVGGLGTGGLTAAYYPHGVETLCSRQERSGHLARNTLQRGRNCCYTPATHPSFR